MIFQEDKVMRKNVRRKIKIPKALWKQVRHTAKTSHVSKNEVIRDALRFYFSPARAVFSAKGKK